MKFLWFGLRSKVKGFSLLEMLVASTMSAIIFGSALSVVSQLYFSQTRVELAQNFYAETRLLQERLSHTIRNSTIDYDRYWSWMVQAEGTSSLLPEEQRLVNDIACTNPDGTGECYACDLGAGFQSYKNFLGGKEIVYSDIYYWDKQNAEIGAQDVDGVLDMKLGIINTENSLSDDCAHAFMNPLKTLFLISGDRSYRTTVAFRSCDDDYCGYESKENVIVLERELGYDLDKDGIVDVWGNRTRFHNERCQVDIDSGPVDVWKEVFGDSTNADFCELAHQEKVISPRRLEIKDLSLTVQPEGDPYLNYEVDEFRRHPFVLWSMDVDFRDYDHYGFKEIEPKRSTLHLSFQTSVSTRVYGNIRPKISNYIYRHCTDYTCSEMK